MNEIVIRIEGLEELTKALQALATGSGAEPEKEPEVKAEESPAVEESGEVQYTLEDVRAALGALQKAGKKEQVKELLQSFGAAKLPEVDPADYPALMQKAGELDA